MGGHDRAGGRHRGRQGGGRARYERQHHSATIDDARQCQAMPPKAAAAAQAKLRRLALTAVQPHHHAPRGLVADGDVKEDLLGDGGAGGSRHGAHRGQVGRQGGAALLPAQRGGAAADAGRGLQLRPGALGGAGQLAGAGHGGGGLRGRKRRAAAGAGVGRPYHRLPHTTARHTAMQPLYKRRVREGGRAAQGFTVNAFIAAVGRNLTGPAACSSA